jgi:hypothetical protein
LFRVLFNRYIAYRDKKVVGVFVRFRARRFNGDINLNQKKMQLF